MQVGEKVFVRNYHHGDKWLPGEISKKTGPVSVLVKLSDGRERRCHLDQVCSRSVEVSPNPPVDLEVPVSPNVVPEPAVPSSGLPDRTMEPILPSSSATDTTSAAPDLVPQKSYPTRSCVPVDRFELA